MNNMQSWEYVGFWKRVFATLVDTIILLSITTPFLYFAYGSGYWNDDEMVNGVVDIVVSYIFPTAAVIWLWHRFGATPGKMLLGARIVDATTGAAPSTGQLVGRYLGYLVSALPLGLGLIWVAFDARKQAWHDKLAGTVVISNKSANTTPATFKPPA